MQFAWYSHVPWLEGIDPSRTIGEFIEQVQYAEELGFTSAWVAEHHFSRYGISSSSPVLLSNVAGKTKTIRFGTAVLVPNLQHPIRLAEDVAMLDRVSRGRVTIGFGRGSAAYEYGGYGVDQSESQARFQEAIKIIKGLWTTPQFSYDGQFYKINNVTLVPRPLQQPMPPIHIAATRTPATLDFVVATGDPIIIGVVLDTEDALDLCHRFVEKSKAAGSNVPMSRIPFFRYVYVAETEQQALADARRSVDWTQDMIQWRATFKTGSEVPHSLEEWKKTRTKTTPTFETIAANRAFFGTPESLVARITALQQEGIETFGCNFAFGGMEHEKVLRSMELFAKEVMPHFAHTTIGVQAAGV